MEDRFKFRAWDGRQMIYFGDGVITPDSNGKIGIFFPMLSDNFSLKKIDIMQCTGLKDINGKLIYEGDTVEITITDAGGEIIRIPKNTVEFHCGSWIVFEMGSCDFYFLGGVDSPEQLEIIGNKFDNPELLEVKS